MHDTHVAASPINGKKTAITSIRNDFPHLQRQVHGRKIVYLDNAATTLKPRSVISAITSYYENESSNVHRALYTTAGEATLRYENSRAAVKELINAKGTQEIVFTRGTTEAINLVAWSWGRANLGEGDEILLTEMEHHSNLVPWQLLAREKKAKLKFIPFLQGGTLDYDAIDTLWSDRIKLVALVHMSNVFGTINDVKQVIDIAHSHEVPVLIDAAQSVPHMPVDVQNLDCDFLAFSGHKMCGPTGVGVLYAKQHVLEAMPPFHGGGDMINAVWPEKSTWNDLPYKFEAGTPNIAGVIGLGAAIDYVQRLGMHKIRILEEKLTSYLLDRLSAITDVTIHGPRVNRGGAVSFTLAGLHPHDIAQYFDAKAIAVRAGHHCAQPVMRKLNIPATVRASVYFYNTTEEIDRLAEAVIGAREFFKHGI
ncbi:MAG: SufS family cysteine desulfurase [Chitinivibrionales bacterium]|nr:SufS family cysteine desulfurase [Chitinivibrionales bacterium]